MDALTKEEEYLRDTFATAALTALLRNLTRSTSFASQPDREREEVAHEKLAAEAYRWADAMMKVRTKS
jgi:hypothetical protein